MDFSTIYWGKNFSARVKRKNYVKKRVLYTKIPGGFRRFCFIAVISS